MKLSTKQLIRITLPILLVLLLVFQIRKRNSQIEHRNNEQQAILNSNSAYAKLLNQRSIYRDSIYRIYIASINDSKEIIFLKKDSLNSMQRESKFFVHLYPKNVKDLVGSVNHNTIDFKSNFTSFTINGQLYNVAHTKLPDYEIEKLNLGQYSFRGNNDVNYKITHLIDSRKVADILKENKETIDNFEYIDKSF
ncbi:hypothetical protein H4O18_02815 [Arenibacter sp. BSSL-BM3]|uniref:Uncharacterized protein n=1 Tax=Arenibacter arenosicollis TaxID=2762274 RepID=A0ABR7QIA0_9FLAO|nr:hypothetical protein [Arenibacter arenosicollis]MBC8766915.1 hypothetical protein [Arenibacter arenosicollis]